MPYYETVFIARQDLSDAQIKDLTASCEKFIKAGGGKVHKTEDWGLRTLAYRIKKNRKGRYILIESDSPAPAVIEMERNLRLNEDILRYMTVRNKTLSSGPSIILNKDSDDGDRTDNNDRNNDRDDREAA